MYFPESENIAREHPDLHRVVGLIDEQLSQICSAAPLRPADFSCVMGADINQVTSVFGLLAQQGVLQQTEMVECVRCDTLMAAEAFRQAVADEDDLECSSCGRVVSARAEPISIYRLTARTLSCARAVSRRKADVVSPALTDSVVASGQAPTHPQKPSAKSWTQSDLDDAIRKYKAERAPSYRDILESVQAGRPGAKKAAQQLFGRNAVARALQVKAPAMVTYSPEWQAIAEELRLSRDKGRNRKASQKIGLDIAIEEQASETAQSGLDAAVQDETIRLIRKSMSRAEAEPLIERLQRGDITDDQARELVEIVKDQNRDSRTRKVRSTP
jgi:hypothetical protein